MLLQKIAASVPWVALAAGFACSPTAVPRQAGAREQSHELAGHGASERARKLTHALIVCDGHVDLPFRLNESQADLSTVAVNEEFGDFSLPRARAGGLDAPFMSIYVPARYQQEGGAKALADALIDQVEALATSVQGFALARSPDEIEHNFRAGLVSLPLGIENGAALEGNVENVAHFHSRGVRYITLTHSKDNALGDSSYDERHSHGGLTPLGRRVVAEMNRLGVLVDVSHVSDDTFRQAVEQSAVPVIASHSSLRHFVPGFERNVSDELLELLASRGGVILINFGSTFLRADSHRVGAQRRELAQAAALRLGLDWESQGGRRRAFAEVDDEAPMVFATVADVADHIDRVRALVGVEHVGLGSDFDGVGDTLPLGLKTPADYANLFDELLRRGYAEADLEKIASGNVLRVWRVAEEYAKRSSAAPHDGPGRAAPAATHAAATAAAGR